MRKEDDIRDKEGNDIDEFLSKFDDPDSGDTSADSISSAREKAVSSDDDLIMGSGNGVDFSSVTDSDRKAKRKVDSFDRASKRYEKEKMRGQKLKEKQKQRHSSGSGKPPFMKHGKDFSRKSFKEWFTLLFKKENPDYTPGAGDHISVNGKSVKNTAYLFSPLRTFRTIVVLLLILMLIFFIYCFVVISMAPKIDPTKIYDNIAESSTVYDDEGNAVDNVYYTEDRKFVSYDEIPKNCINAFVALEDKTFWKHNGFNWTRMIGAVFQSITGQGAISGTSTITQQLARNVYLPNIKSQRSIRRKVIEMYYASQIEHALTKKEIITAYLNTIYLGFGNYGIDTAAHSYFSKDPKDLTLEESAALAALPQAPDSYALVKLVDSSSVTEGDTNIIMREPDTYIANDASKSRRHTCLDLMYKQGYITKAQHDEAYSKELIDFINPDIKTNSSDDSYFTDYMIDEVKQDLMDKYNITEEEANRMIYTGGLNIYSTMDSTAQSTIVKEFSDSSNFPYLTNISYDRNQNILDSSGNIVLYKYSNFFDDSGNFTLSSNEATVNSDGSVTIKRGHRLNIYRTESNGIVDYSLEFKQTYVMDNGTLTVYPGGYINIPAEYKKLDKNEDLVISAKFFKENPNKIKIDGDTITLTEDVYSLPSKVIQPQAAMVIVEVGTGQIKAMVGGRQVEGRQLYNRAINTRQSGSSIKPLTVYGAALQKSYELQAEGQKFTYHNVGNSKQGTSGYGDYLTAASTVVDEPLYFNGKQWPKNAENNFVGSVTMRKAMQQSINTCAVKIEQQVGDEYAAKMAKKFGLTTLVTDPSAASNDMNAAALALGGLTKGVKPLEMAQAYATFPNGGVRKDSIAYTKVTDRNGKVILKSKSKSHKVLDEGVAWIMTDMLKSVVTDGLGSPAALSGVQAGGKTGTTSDNYDIWFDGFTPHYAAVIWIGSDVNIKMSSMSNMAAALWGKIINQIPKAKTGSYKKQPSDVIKSNGEYFTKGTESGQQKLVMSGETQETTTETTTEEQTTTTPESGSTTGESTGGTTGGSTGGTGGSTGGNTGGSTGGSTGGTTGGSTGGNTGGSTGGGTTP